MNSDFVSVKIKQKDIVIAKFWMIIVWSGGGATAKPGLRDDYALSRDWKNQ